MKLLINKAITFINKDVKGPLGIKVNSNPYTPKDFKSNVNNNVVHGTGQGIING